jgi:hypothetical protein
VTHRRLTLAERRALKQLSKRPRTREVPHPFLLPNLRHEQK